MTLWSADLVEMQKLAKQNKGYRYVLMVINVFSKYGWADPLETKSKSTSAVTLAFKKILKDFQKIMDYGFTIRQWKICYRGKIDLYSTHNDDLCG